MAAISHECTMCTILVNIDIMGLFDGVNMMVILIFCSSSICFVRMWHTFMLWHPCERFRLLGPSDLITLPLSFLWCWIFIYILVNLQQLPRFVCNSQRLFQVGPYTNLVVLLLNLDCYALCILSYHSLLMCVQRKMGFSMITMCYLVTGLEKMFFTKVSISLLSKKTYDSNVPSHLHTFVLNHGCFARVLLLVIFLTFANNSERST